MGMCVWAIDLHLQIIAGAMVWQKKSPLDLSVKGACGSMGRYEKTPGSIGAEG